MFFRHSQISMLRYLLFELINCCHLYHKFLFYSFWCIGNHFLKCNDQDRLIDK